MAKAGTLIDKKTFDNLHRLVAQDPKISNRKIAEILDLTHDTVAKWRRRTKHPDGKADISDLFVGPTPREALTEVEEHHLRRENTALKNRIRELMDEQVRSSRLSEFAAELSENPVKVPKWTARNHRKGKDVATPVAFASDWHLDEVVNRAQMGGMNEYNRKIAEVRCGNFFDNTVRLAKEFINGMQYNGIYLLLGGDIFSGNIHEELKVTNETTIIESILYWTGPIVAGIRHLADEFGSVHIPCVVGNHGRMSVKPVAKNRVQDNFDYLFYNMLAMNLQDDERITWDISPAADCLFNISECQFLFTHGDQFRGGSGIAGAVHPWLLGNARKLKTYNGMGKSYTNLVMGHWHQLTLGIQGMMVNGSLKGFDEYALTSNFPFEPPQQALWLVQPKVGITGRWPIHVLGDNEKY